MPFVVRMCRYSAKRLKLLHSSPTPAPTATQEVLFSQQDVCVIAATEETIVDVDFGATNFVIIDLETVIKVVVYLKYTVGNSSTCFFVD